MRSIDDIKSIRDIPILRDKAMEIAHYIFTKSQENLTEPVAWGDDRHPSDRADTIISDTGDLLLSGTPPEWVDDNRIEFNYDCPYCLDIEYGSPPHFISSKILLPWVIRKLGIRNTKKAKVIAHNIANKIKRFGISPHPFIRPAISSGESKYNMQVITRPNK